MHARLARAARRARVASRATGSVVTRSVRWSSNVAGSTTAATPSTGAASAAAAATPKPHVSLEVTPDGIAVVTFDNPTDKMNVLGKAVMDQIEPIMSRIESDASIRAAVLISGKPDNFIAGADITMLAAAKDAKELSELSHAGQKLMDRLAASKRPIVAAINGACLGGGLEVALACTYRIATSSPKTSLGVPEVQLGLLPGAGGTQRLPKVVGIQEAIKMATAGAPVKADKAKKIGLVHEVVDPFALRTVALQAARELASGELKPAAKPKGLLAKVLEDNPLGRNYLLFPKAREAIKKVAGSHYPAPFAIVDCIEEGINSGHAAGSAKERALFGSLGMTDVSKALRGIFFSQTATKRNPVPKDKLSAGSEVKTVGILGAGLMGAGVAQVTANAGYSVVLKDRDAAGLARGEAQLADAFAQRVQKKRMRAFDRDVTLARITGVSDADASWQKHIGRCDLVVEAVFEDMGLKHKVIQGIEPLLPKHAIFATNTSALPIAEIAKAAARPERVIGMHYFSPVDKMPLLEIIPHAGTADEVVGRAFEVGIKQGKTVIVVKDVPGFYVNRCLGPWAAEALYMVQQGVDAARLDKAVKNWGYPVGPVTLADEVGIDVLFHTYGTLAGALGPRMGGASDGWLKEMVAAKMLGRKTGKGFYLYPTVPKGQKAPKDKQINPAAAELVAKHSAGAAAEAGLKEASDDVLVERMVLRFVKECMHSLEDGIIKSPGDGDIGAVFGLGFPPFRGGPFRYADSVGAQKMADTMARYADKHGERFAPPQILKDKAKAGATFHKA